MAGSFAGRGPSDLAEMTGARKKQLLILLLIVVCGYFWLGIFVFFIALCVFMLYEMMMPPPRYRRLGPGQIEEAEDNRFGRFGLNYREDEPDLELAVHVGRNERCPCGSGLKYKRCCLAK